MHFTDVVFNLINGIATKSKVLDLIMMNTSKFGPYILMVIGIITYIVGVLKRKKELRLTVVDTVIKTGIAIVISQIIGSIFYMPRPFVNNSNVNLLYYHSSNSSFPSDHSIGSMGIALGLNKGQVYLSNLYIAFAILIGVSRVYVGHHYPLDVIGGFVLVSLISKLYDKFLKEIVGKIYTTCEDILLSKILTN